jgi:ribosomal-protein-alanine N-acetyltransferase
LSAGPLWVAWAGAEDVETLHAIERASYTHPWSERSLREAVAEQPATRVLLLRACAEVAGYCIFRVVADEAEVLNLAVHPDRRRQGLARRLLRVALAFAARAGARSAWLEVREGNLAARRLYAGFGFAERGRRAAYYEEPREDALVLCGGLPPDESLNSPNVGANLAESRVWASERTLRERAFRRTDNPFNTQEVAMAQNSDPVRDHLLKDNEEFRRLDEQHRDLDKRLQVLTDKVVLSDEEQVEETTLKKKKLQLKDRMEAIARQARTAAHS